MELHTVQECGCIAIPEDIQDQTGLRAGATFRTEVSADGSTLILRVIERAAPAVSPLGAVCQTQSR